MMNVEPTGSEQVILSLESSSPFGHLQTAVGPLTAGAPGDPGAPDLPFVNGARRQRWEQRSWSQGLEMAGWERVCMSWGERKQTIKVQLSDVIMCFSENKVVFLKPHFQSKRLPRSLQKNLLIFAGVLVG